MMESVFGYEKKKTFCPKCGRKSFNLQTLNGEVIEKTVGYCDHSNSCGYIYYAKDYLRQNPKHDKVDYSPVYIPEKKEPSYIDASLIKEYRSNESGFIKYLLTVFPCEKVKAVTDFYYIGADSRGNVIFWQIDEYDKVRTGKIMSYDTNGHRNGYMNWMHSVLKMEGFNLVQSLFGANLLLSYPNKTVCLVESAKTVLIASIVFPEYLWLSTEGAKNYNKDKLMPLRGRKVLVYPDLWRNTPTGKDDWHGLVKLLNTIGAKATYCDILEKSATPEQCNDAWDLADFIIHEFKN